MTAQKGKDLLLKVDPDGAGSFTMVAGLRARTLAFNAATVEPGLRGRRPGFSSTYFPNRASALTDGGLGS
jgi:hypothetical protein